MANVIFKISNGKTTFLMNEHTKAFIPATAVVLRASHVVPTDIASRKLFNALRAPFADESKVAAWTRTWKCKWQADLSPVNGPVLGPFDSRVDAIEAEIEWLNKNFLAV